MSAVPVPPAPVECVLERPAAASAATHADRPRAGAISAHRRALAAAVDVSMFLAGSLLAAGGAHGAGVEPLPAVWVVLFGGLLFAALGHRHLYDRHFEARTLDDTLSIIAATTLTCAVVYAVEAMARGATNGRPLLREWAFVSVYLLVGRFVVGWTFRAAARAGGAARATLIVGSGRVGSLIARRLLARPELGLAPIGFLDTNPSGAIERPPGVPVLGSSAELDRVVKEHRVGEVVIAFTDEPDEAMLDVMRRCETLEVDVAFVPRFFEDFPEHTTIEHLGGVALLTPRHADPRGWQFALKYALDRVVAAAVLVVVSPLLLVLAGAIRLTMGGPVLFRQVRVGRDGKPFQMLKFRSMREPRSDAPSFVLPDGLGPGGVEGVDRTTAVGRLLRSTSLDELPQLFNVVRGEMSLVGPRPERPEFVERFEGNVYRYGERHRVKAGITGWAQVHGLRGRTSIADRAEWDNFYIENFSLWLDLKIVLLTAGAVLRMLLAPRPSA